MKKLIIAAAALAAVSTTTAASAQATSSSARTTAGARLIKPLTLTADLNLNFGTIVMGTLTADQTVTLSPAGAISCGTSGLTCAATGQAARFTVTGTQGQQVRIQSGQTSLTTPNGAGGTLVFTPVLASPTVTLPNSGTQGTSFNVGGSIVIAANQQDGVYSGEIEVLVEY
jgi:hypothetical protein